jgi:hypothetical protein
MARKKTSATGQKAAAAVDPRFQTKSSRQRCCDGKVPHAAAVSVRRLTQEEERQLEAVLDHFLMKIVHEHFERQHKSC